MICAWDKLLRILPTRMRDEVDQYGARSMQELRLRIDKPPLLCIRGERHRLSGIVKQEDLDFVINTASNYSPWTAGTIAKGFLTAEGGHRIGLCGEAVMKNGQMEGIKKITSINIRVARDYPGVSGGIKDPSGSLLVIGPPGSGKTTLLRDLIRRVAEKENVAVVDERGELFPTGCFETGNGADILCGCPKKQGIEMLLRTMGPEWIAVDEITSPDDCEAMIQAGWCGVNLLATAHAERVQDLRGRPLYRHVVSSGLFSTVCILRPDQTYHLERLTL